jgi:hypothetical protein
MYSKISGSKEELVHDGSLSLSPFARLEGSGFRPMFSPSIENQRSLLHSQIFHDPSSSPFALHLSGNRNSERTPFEKGIKNDSILSSSPFDWIGDRRLSELKQVQCFNIDSSTREHIRSFDIPAATRQIQQSDIEYLKSVINTDPEPTIKKLSNKKVNKSKGKGKGRNENPSQGTKRRLKPFMCKYCTMTFNKAQALGGHMSRTHPGESHTYMQKKVIRKNRKLERVKLLLAKIKFFKSLDYDYNDLLSTPEGKMRARMLINRTRIKKLKRTLTKEEVEDFMKDQVIDDIST